LTELTKVIKVSDAVYAKLEQLGGKGETFNDIIKNVLEKAGEPVHEGGQIITSLEEFLESKIPPSPDKDSLRNAEIERFKRKWGEPDSRFPDDSPGAQPPYISLEKTHEIKYGDKVLMNLRIFNRPLYKPEELSAFNADQWKDFAYGKMEDIVDNFRSKGFSVGERELRLDEIRLLLTSGDKHKAREILESYFTSGLFAIDKEDTVCIGIRQVKRQR